MIIEMKFNQNNKKAVLEGRKRCTSRFEPKGVAGDTFCVGEKLFELINVTALRLGDVANDLYRDEGFESPEEFIRAWNEIYCTWKRKVYSPDKIVITHYFREVKA